MEIQVDPPSPFKAFNPRNVHRYQIYLQQFARDIVFDAARVDNSWYENFSIIMSRQYSLNLYPLNLITKTADCVAENERWSPFGLRKWLF